MQYCTRDALLGSISARLIDQALQEPGKTVDEVWASVQDRVADAIHHCVQGRVATPFSTPLPPIVAEAAIVFSCEVLYQRRGVSSKDNPFTSAANRLRERLEAIGKGSGDLNQGMQDASNPALIIGEDAKTASSGGYLLT